MTSQCPTLHRGISVPLRPLPSEVDYPTLLARPPTSFSCDEYEYPGLYADVEADCQVSRQDVNERDVTSEDVRWRHSTQGGGTVCEGDYRGRGLL